MARVRYAFSSRNRSGFTLLEVIISSLILSIVFLAAIVGMLFVSRMSQAAQQDLMAMEILDRETELIRAAPDYAALGNPAMVGPHPTNPTYEDRSFTEQQVRPYDPNFPASAPVFTIDFTWYGFGTATGGSLREIRFDQTGWPVGTDFTGSYVILREGVGAGQMAFIEDHSTAGTFDLDAAFNGYTESNLMIAPTAGTTFEVDGGKWVRVTARWNPTPNDDERVVERMLFISNR